MPEIMDIVLRAVFSVVILFFLTKLMGKKQISQLTFFDYVVGITIGSIAAEMASTNDIPLHLFVIAMIVYALFSIAISWLTNKFLKARHFLTGTPLVLIERGEIIRGNLKSAKYDINDLLRECRVGGYFNVADIEYAVMEASGDISFLAVSDKRPLTPEDMKLKPKQEDVVANVIIDGKIMPKNLEHVGKDDIWLDRQVKKQKLKIEEIVLGTCDADGVFTAYKRKQKPHKNTVFE